MVGLSAPTSGEALPMEYEFKQGYRMYRVLSNLNQLDVNRLDDADRERSEPARYLLEEVSLLTRPGNGAGADAHADSQLASPATLREVPPESVYKSIIPFIYSSMSASARVSAPKSLIGWDSFLTRVITKRELVRSILSIDS